MLSLGFRKTGYLRFKFLCESLKDLRDRCKEKGGNLLIQIGLPEEIIPHLIKQHHATHLVYQKEIASEELAVEENLEQALMKTQCTSTSIWGKTLYHIDDSPFPPSKTPLTSKSFRMKLTKNADVRPLIETPKRLLTSPTLHEWGTIPLATDLGYTSSEIYEPKQQDYIGGESYGLKRLKQYTFETEQLTSYRWTRNRSLGMEYSSKFSPWMAVGSLSPRQIYWTVKKYEKEIKKNASTWWLIFEVVWRDFFKYTAMRFGDKMFYEGGIRDRTTEWKNDHSLFEKWKTGHTGIPFVDAHIRELNQTGFMSNRGRVNCASFLTRDYQLDWRWGAAWFEHTLLDYDVCSNWLNWNTQATEIWYTNPVHQGMKYDKTGAYVRRWIDALANVPGPIIQVPWLLSLSELEELGADDYPKPEVIYAKWSRSINRIQKAYQQNLNKDKKIKR